MSSKIFGNQSVLSKNNVCKILTYNFLTTSQRTQ